MVSSKTPYPILEIELPADLAEDLSWDLSDAGAVAVEVRDSTTMSAARESTVLLVAGFENVAARQVAKRNIESQDSGSLVIREIDEVDGDWQIRWREFFKPVVLEQLQVITPWMSPPRTDRESIVIDPGQAFGTGGHETTTLVLEMLEGRAKDAGLPSTVLDVGTGSGVLAIAAKKLGAREILGIDIDEVSVIAFQENAERNGTTEGLSCVLADAAKVEGTWPLVLANIQLDVFLKESEAIRCRVAKGGEIFISGILIEQVETCLSLWPGFDLIERREAGEWAALALKRR